MDEFSSYPEQIPRSPDAHLIFMACFVDGYSIRQQFEYFRTMLTAAPMYFDREGLSIKRGNGPETLITSTRILAKRLVEYTFNPEYINEPDRQRHVVNINLKDFYNQIKSLAKKEGIRVFQYAESPGTLVCQMFGSTKNNAGYTRIKTEAFDEKDYVVDDGIAPDATPNLKITLTSFCAACNTFDRASYTYGIFKCYPRAVSLYAANETVSSDGTNMWGTITHQEVQGRKLITKTDPYFVTKVPIALIRALKKMNGWNVNGIVSIFCVKDRYVRLETSVGCFGENVTHLIEKDGE